MTDLESFIERNLATAAKIAVMLPESQLPLQAVKTDKSSPKKPSKSIIVEALDQAMDRDRLNRSGDVTYLIVALDDDGDPLASMREIRRGTAEIPKDNSAALATALVNNFLTALPKILDANEKTISMARSAMDDVHGKAMTHLSIAIGHVKDCMDMVKDHRETEDALAKQLTIAQATSAGGTASEQLQQTALQIGAVKDLAIGLLGPAVPVVTEYVKELIVNLSAGKNRQLPEVKQSPPVSGQAIPNPQPPSTQSFGIAYSPAMAKFRATLAALTEEQIAGIVGALMSPSTHGSEEQRDKVIKMIAIQSKQPDMLIDAIVDLMRPSGLTEADKN